MVAGLGACAPSEPDEGSAADSVTTTTCVTVQRGANGSAQDAMLSNPPMAGTFGTLPIVRVGGKDEGLFWFGLTAVPANAVVSSATLTLFVNGSASDAPINVHRATAPWSEASVSYASFGQSYALPTSAVLHPTSANAFKSVDVTSVVQAWVSGGQANNGLVLETASPKKTIFVSAEGSDVTQRPALRVCYTTPPIDHCASDPCANGGACANDASGFTCTCAAGYAGATCADAIDECAASPCQHGGSCTDGVASYTCTCPTGYTGPNCETLVDNCAAAPCENGGTCTNAVGGYTCACVPGFDGTKCETQIDDCAAAPCQNGGTCHDELAGYSCTCAAGYAGTNCDVVVDHCAPGACQNGGTCVNEVNGFSCACAPGYTGASCETEIDNCAANPCQNGATCTNHIDSYTCTCADGYAGENCETDIDDCAAAPCHNGGLCIDEVAGFACQCEQGYSGVACDVVDPCLGQPSVYAGNYVITNQASVDALACITEITGVLVVQPGVSTLALPRLERVDNYFEIQNDALITSVDLGHATLGGFYLDGNPALTSFRFAPLPSVMNRMFIRGCPQLAELGPTGLSGVQHVTGNVEIANTALTNLGPTGLSSLLTVGDSLDFTGNPVLVDIGSLAQLTSVTNSFTLQYDPLLTSVDVSHATFGGFYLDQDPALTSFRLPPLPAQLTRAFIRGCPQLSDLGSTGFSGLQRVTAQLMVANTALTNLGPTGLSSLTSVGARMDITGNPLLADIGSLAQLTSVTSYFVMQYDPLITSVDLSHAAIGGFYLDQDPGLTSFRLAPMPAQLSEAFIRGCPLLADLGPTGFSGLQRVTEAVMIANTALTSVDLSSLTTVGTHFLIVSNPSLASVGSLAHLTSVPGSLQLQINPLITDLDLSSLATLGDLYVVNNTSLASMELDAVPSIGASLVIGGNASLTSLGLAALHDVASSFSIFSNASLCNSIPLGIRSHTTVGGTTTISGNHAGC